MKKLNGKYKPPPSLSVIEAARAGEADARNRFCDTMMDTSTNCVCER